jgi:7-cyano-7-deazaguanine synthase
MTMKVQKELPGTSPVDGARPAVVVLSGGQDSMTCLALALSRHEQVFAVCFDYGQKHRIEIDQARLIAREAGVPLQVVDVRFFGDLVTSALVENGDVNAAHDYKPGLPASFVPNRNALFLTIAHALAQENGAGYIYTGVCQTDYSGYPDCRHNFILSLQTALNIGYETGIEIVTPMMYLDKAQTFELADRLGVLADVIELSHTCYTGDRNHRHDWGHGCGKCPACQLRSKGYDQFRERLAVPA